MWSVEKYGPKQRFKKKKKVYFTPHMFTHLPLNP
jgi:hypothetical protein